MIEKTINALSEPRRRDILKLVQNGELASSAIAAHFDVSAPAVSQHLKVLEDAGLVAVRAGSSTVKFRLYPEANGTRVVLTHSGLPEAGIPSQLQGWVHYTSRLQDVAIGLDPGPDPYATPPGR